MSFTLSATDVKNLREATGAGMMDCKAALTEAEGDFEKAIEILRKKGQKLSVKRADRDAKEGVVIAMVTMSSGPGPWKSTVMVTEPAATRTDSTLTL